jgi:bifunctional non-homologous end joining protein LigD
MVKKVASPVRRAAFIEPMESLSVEKLPAGENWSYEIKLDGYRVQAVNQKELTLYSRRRNVLNKKFPDIAQALKGIPHGTVVDGELVALGPDGRPSFNLLQNFRSAESHLMFYAFDLLVHEDRDLTHLPLSERRKWLQRVITQNEHVNLSIVSTRPSEDILEFVRHHRLEGVVAKRTDSVYQPGKRTGLWRKFKVNLGQEFVVGGYIPSDLGLDSLIIGFYRGKDLIYAGRVRAGFVPATRRSVFNKIKGLATVRCPFVNLPELSSGRWGEGLTATKMKDCVWVRPVTVAQVEFLEWTGADHLRHTKFISLRDDKDPRKAVKEA